MKMKIKIIKRNVELHITNTADLPILRQVTKGVIDKHLGIKVTTKFGRKICFMELVSEDEHIRILQNQNKMK